MSRLSHLCTLAAAAGCLLLTSCASSVRAFEPQGELVTEAQRAALRSSLPIFSGEDGSPMTWDDLVDRMGEADVVVIGELHDDHIGHAVQLALVEDVFARFPDRSRALSMEMLDRSEQAVVDDYLADIIDRDEFIELTASTRWRKLARQYLAGEIKRDEFVRRISRAGWPDWEVNYQPIIDAAKDAGAHVIAANAPWARYGSLVEVDDDYARFQELTAAQQALVDWPAAVPAGKYRERFWEVMAGRAEGEETEEEETADEEDAAAEDPHGMMMTDEQVLKAFRSQLIYDATMAGSIARGVEGGRDLVIHLVGQFHSDFEGGTVSLLREQVPGVRVLTVSMQRAFTSDLLEDDEGRADVVIYTAGDYFTGATPPPPPAEDEEAASQPDTQPTSQPDDA